MSVVSCRLIVGSVTQAIKFKIGQARDVMIFIAYAYNVVPNQSNQELFSNRGSYMSAPLVAAVEDLT